MKNLQHFCMRLQNLFIAFTLLLGLVSCTALPVAPPWGYADLRALDAPDAPSPAVDILAVYTRTTRLSVDIRVDLLDINAGDQYSLKINLWDNRDFSQEPLTIEVSSTGKVQTLGIPGNTPFIWPRVIQDTLLDTITISLNRSFIGARYRLDVSSYTANALSPADEVLAVRSDAQPPDMRAPLLLAFWNTFPVATPIQAMRRWDGAHAGPYGLRHGLAQLLNAAGRNGIPVALLDIKNPASLAALDFMGVLPKIRSLAAHGLLILPDAAFGEPADMALQFSRRAALGFGLPASQVVYADNQDPAAIPSASGLNYRASFQPLSDGTHLAGYRGRRLIPLPQSESTGITQSGLPVEARRRLIQTALSQDLADLIVLGGSLPDSAWGDLDAASPAFAWLAAHPWIQPLGEQDLLTFPVGVQAGAAGSAPSEQLWLGALRAAPDNALTTLAWQVFLTLTAPAAGADLQALQAKSLGQVGVLLEAAGWAETGTARADCLSDLDADGRAECVLANQNSFAILETNGARLTHFFYLDANGPHQLVGPSAQFTVGLGDPSGWRSELGDAADPGAIMGAFLDDTNTWIDYLPVVTSESITFTSTDGSRIKSFRLSHAGIEVQYQVDGPVTARIPLVLDPQEYYSGSTEYRSTLADRSWFWSLAGGIGVEVRTDAALSAEGFTSAFPFVSASENPDREYPQGMYLPFPLSLVTVHGDGTFNIHILYKNPSEK
jgi:hypothetical protein